MKINAKFHCEKEKEEKLHTNEILKFEICGIQAMN